MTQVVVEKPNYLDMSWQLPAFFTASMEARRVVVVREEDQYILVSPRRYVVKVPRIPVNPRDFEKWIMKVTDVLAKHGDPPVAVVKAWVEFLEKLIEWYSDQEGLVTIGYRDETISLTIPILEVLRRLIKSLCGLSVYWRKSKLLIVYEGLYTEWIETSIYTDQLVFAAIKPRPFLANSETRRFLVKKMLKWLRRYYQRCLESRASELAMCIVNPRACRDP